DGVDSVAQGAFAAVLEAIQRARATVYVITDAQAIIRELKRQVKRGPSPLQRIDPVARKMHALLQQYAGALEAGQEPMRKLAEETGGKLLSSEAPIRCPRPDDPQSSKPPERFTDCRALANQAFAEIASEYIVAYSTQRKVGDTAFHAIQAYSTRTDLQIR